MIVLVDAVLVQSGTTQIDRQMSAFVVVEAYITKERSCIVSSVTSVMARIVKSTACAMLGDVVFRQGLLDIPAQRIDQPNR